VHSPRVSPLSSPTLGRALTHFHPFCPPPSLITNRGAALQPFYGELEGDEDEDIYLYLMGGEEGEEGVGEVGEGEREGQGQGGQIPAKSQGKKKSNGEGNGKKRGPKGKSNKAAAAAAAAAVTLPALPPGAAGNGLPAECWAVVAGKLAARCPPLSALQFTDEEGEPIAEDNASRQVRVRACGFFFFFTKLLPFFQALLP
jgi:hypothetical protein